jgi:toxin ParE1/3/4
MKARFSKTAVGEINDAIKYLAGRNPTAAVGLSKAIESAVRRLEEHPFSGRAIDSETIRSTGVVKFNYLILYEVKDGELLIHRVRHGARKPLEGLYDD